MTGQSLNIIASSLFFINAAYTIIHDHDFTVGIIWVAIGGVFLATAFTTVQRN